MSGRLDVVLVTCGMCPALDADDAPLVDALSGLGLRVGAVLWDDPFFLWRSARLAVLRSTWDYHLRPEAFLEWLETVAAEVPVLNPAPVVRWNSHKGYLAALAAAGCPVVPTAHLPHGAPVDLAALMAERGWADAVVKPAVSLDSWETFRARAGDLASAQKRLADHLAVRDMMVQPFVASTEGSGERCLVFLDDGRTPGLTLSHVVRKRSLFQGGRHAGPEGTPVEPAADEIDVARRVLAAAPPADLLYARVDLARDERGQPQLMELELIEPTLFLRGQPEAAGRLAAGIARRLGAGLGGAYSSSLIT